MHERFATEDLFNSIKAGVKVLRAYEAERENRGEGRTIHPVRSPSSGYSSRNGEGKIRLRSYVWVLPALLRRKLIKALSGAWGKQELCDSPSILASDSD